MKSIKRQGGFATILLVIALMGAAAAMMMGLKMSIMSAADNNSFGKNTSEVNRQRVLNENAQRLRHFIEANSNVFSATILPSIYTEDYILSKAGIFDYDTYRFRLGITNLQQYNNSNAGDNRGILQGRDFYLWLTPEDKVDTTVFTPTSINNVVSDPESVFVKISSKNIEMDKYSEAVRKMENVAVILKNVFAANLEADPLHDASANYFANLPCGYRPAYLSGVDTIACSGSAIGSFAPLSSLGLVSNSVAPSISVNPADLKTPWGGDIEISNIDTNGASITISGQAFKVYSKSPPYTVALRTVTPSGFSIIKTVVQPF